ncbi:MAG: CHAD domain-containing protein [Rhodobacterales bacterium]|nr:CHAD domain-containing protein [Rhodobacterales bacterium]MDX5501625.1 CHAD domain-containing protein [Rhodobacterales bacterium]
MAEPDEPLLPSTTCEAAFRQIARDCARDFAEALDKVLDCDAPEGPHKARVALRRLTTAIDAFSDLLRRKRQARLRDQVKAIFRLLGKLRDSDVHLETRCDMPGHKGRLRRNARIRAKVRKRLKSLQADQLAARVARLTAQGGKLWRRSEAARATQSAPVGGWAVGRLAAAWADCGHHGASVATMDPLARHEFRKDLKSMRYLVEFLGPVVPGLDQEPFRSDFRDIQDALGILNDWQVAMALEGRALPKVLPGKQARALVAAEALWLRLSTAPLPWA